MCRSSSAWERTFLCSELKTKNRLHQEYYARSCQELKRRCYQEENTETQRRLEEFLTQHAWSGITYSESIGRSSTKMTRTFRVYWRFAKSLYDPRLTEQLWQCLHSSSSSYYNRVQGSLAAILECCEIHENIWVFLETFLIDNMLDEIMMNYTIIREILADIIGDSETRRNWEKWSEEPLQLIPISCLSVKAR